MTFPDKILAATQWALANPKKIARYLLIAQGVTGILLLYGAYTIGKTPFHLLQSGVLTRGVIIDHAIVNLNTALIGTASKNLKAMPIIEFEHNGKKYQFQDRYAQPYYVPSNTPFTDDVILRLRL